MIDCPLKVTEYYVPVEEPIEPEIINTDTGFPFDDSEQEYSSRPRNSSFRSHIDELASRHPEFADHLRPFGSDFPSFRGDTWGRKRHPSGSCGEDDNRSQASGVSSSSAESTQNHFPDFEESIFDAGIKHHPFRKYFDSRHQHKPEPSVPTKEEQEQPKSNLSQYGLRNTVDLGQKQKCASFDEEAPRSHRSMSAPPDNRSAQPQQRFVSRINIEPVNPDTPKQQHDMGASSAKPNVRHIPIFVEGRDEPVLAKNIDKEQATTQSDTHGPSKYMQFMNRNPPKQPQNEQQANVKTAETKQQQELPPEPAKTAPPSNDPLDKIEVIRKDVSKLAKQVESFTGTSKKDKQYLYLDEMLTRDLLKLDDIETEGKENVRQARKEVIRQINNYISILESVIDNSSKTDQQIVDNEQQSTEDDKTEQQEMEMAVESNEQGTSENVQPMETDQVSQTNETEEMKSLQVGGIERTGSQIKLDTLTQNQEEQKTVEKTEPKQIEVTNQETEPKVSENTASEGVNVETKENTAMEVQTTTNEEVNTSSQPQEENKNVT